MTAKDNADSLPEGCPLESLYEGPNAHPFHEWIVTHEGGVEGWWGEGYVLRTVDPFLVFKWGFTTKNENSAMSGGFELSEGHYLSLLLLNAGGASDYREDIESLTFAATIAAVKTVQRIISEPDPTDENEPVSETE